MIDRVKTGTAVVRAKAVTDAEPERFRDMSRLASLNVKPSLPKLVSLAAELAKQGPPVDFAKIAQIRQAIASGTYVVDLEATSAAILAFDRANSETF
jgi:flagellar biosynthesis anti-sigma factor FlgM